MAHFNFYVLVCVMSVIIFMNENVIARYYPILCISCCIQLCFPFTTLHLNLEKVRAFSYTHIVHYFAKKYFQHWHSKESTKFNWSLWLMVLPYRTSPLKNFKSLRNQFIEIPKSGVICIGQSLCRRCSYDVKNVFM